MSLNRVGRVLLLVSGFLLHSPASAEHWVPAWKVYEIDTDSIRTGPDGVTTFSQRLLPPLSEAQVSAQKHKLNCHTRAVYITVSDQSWTRVKILRPNDEEALALVCEKAGLSASASTLRPTIDGPAVIRPVMSASCKSALGELQKIDMSLSAITAQGAVGTTKSAALRASEEDNLRSLASDSVRHLKLENCPLQLPLSVEPYLLAAIKCEKDKLRLGWDSSPISCNRSLWKSYRD